MEKLVERITAKINQARQANFYQAIKIWQSFRKEPLSFMHVLDQNLESFDLKDLSQSKMSIIKDASEKGKYRYGEKVRSN
ncbi:MAG: hypothetical protein KDD35_05705, partial [Bdellovibrionales bacterium]|nr:hypothetical protein [Bdellovibrionales bacterium]